MRRRRRILRRIRRAARRIAPVAISFVAPLAPITGIGIAEARRRPRTPRLEGISERIAGLADMQFPTVDKLPTARTFGERLELERGQPEVGLPINQILLIGGAILIIFFLAK